jgi:peptidylprolyl isomerase
MTQAKTGDKVKVHFEGCLVDGTVFGSTMDEEPFQFTIGEKNMLPSFENAVVGMRKGDTNKITLTPAEAYGPHKKERVFGMEKSGFPPEIKLEIGKQLRVRKQDGEYAVVTVKHFSEDSIVLDENDPLAGKTLTFEIELVEII